MIRYNIFETDIEINSFSSFYFFDYSLCLLLHKHFDFPVGPNNNSVFIYPKLYEYEYR